MEVRHKERREKSVLVKEVKKTGQKCRNVASGGCAGDAVAPHSLELRVCRVLALVQYASITFRI